MKKTKIIATIGPSTWDRKILDKMFQVGLNIARINASFADDTEIQRVAKLIRNVSPNISLMLDTQGHKIRLNDFKNPIKVSKNQLINLYDKPQPNKLSIVTESQTKLFSQLPINSIILIDDGMVKLKIIEKKYDYIVCKVLNSGTLKRLKTVNIPNVHIDFPKLSKKDTSDIKSALKNNYDFLSLSFVRNKEDIKEAKKLLGKNKIKIISKIENAEGIENFDEILEHSDGIMVARGDMGIEIPMEKVPVIQEEIIKKCNLACKPVIVATQMLQSMVENPTPTRAEINDIADAVSDGADAVMLSAETSVGKYPVQSVQYMNKTIIEIEKTINPINLPPSDIAKPFTNAIAESVIESCDKLKINKILVATGSGTTAKVIARYKPKQMIYAFTNDLSSSRALNIFRGIIPDVLTKISKSRDIGIANLVKFAKKKKYVKDNDLIIVVAGANLKSQKATNMMEINYVKDFLK